jgi:exopolysaccharide biosynthesis polyprenyl glycosylphosphotransferase
VTGGTRAIDRIEPEADTPAETSPQEPGACEVDESPCWPVTRLMGWTLTVALGFSILGPVTAAGARGAEWFALLLPAIVGTLGARALFETLRSAAGTHGPAAGSHSGLRVLATAIAPALLATAVMAVASVIVGVRWSLLAGATTASLAMLTLTTAGAIREVEIRLRLSLRRVYFIGASESRRELGRELARRSDAPLVGAQAAIAPLPEPARHALVAAVLESRATVVVLDAHAMRVPELVDAASQLNLAGLRIRDLVSYYESEFKKIPLSELSPTWFLFDIASIHQRGISSLLRRVIEALVAAAMLLISLPVLLLAAALIKLTSPGPVFYRQRRVGLGGVPFTLVKLRTMSLTQEPVAAWAPAEAHRVTRVGRILRRFRLDELPQFWNVIRGDLALVGPRPEQVPIVERLDRELPHYAARHCIRPGITGWAQVNLGYAGSVEGTMAKLQRDLYYVKHSSLRLDGLIIWLTIKTVIAGRG